MPPDKNRILLTVEGFQSIASGMLILLSSLYHSSTSAFGHDQISATSPPSTPGYFMSEVADFRQPPHPDIHLLQDLIPQFLSGSLDELDDDKVEETYGVEYGTSDRKDIRSIRKAIFTDSLLLTIENTPGTGEWLFCNLIEVNSSYLLPFMLLIVYLAILARPIVQHAVNTASVDILPEIEYILSLLWNNDSTLSSAILGYAPSQS